MRRECVPKCRYHEHAVGRVDDSGVKISSRPSASQRHYWPRRKMEPEETPLRTALWIQTEWPFLNIRRTILWDLQKDQFRVNIINRSLHWLFQGIIIRQTHSNQEVLSHVSTDYEPQWDPFAWVQCECETMPSTCTKSAKPFPSRCRPFAFQSWLWSIEWIVPLNNLQVHILLVCDE